MKTQNILICGLVLLFAVAVSGCISHKEWIPPKELKSQIGARADVLTKNGDVYQLEGVVISSLCIRGVGTKLGVDQTTTRFRGEISRDSVALVQLYRRSGTWKGLEAACIAGLVVAAVKDVSGDNGKGAFVTIRYPYSGGYGSCPLAFSYDGQQYQLESETYVGAICQGLQRTATDVLKHMEPTEGQYRIKIANASPESHYTDNVRLLAVDHPSGTRMVADAMGGLHTISVPVRPAIATDLRGKEAMSLVSEADSIPWQTDLRTVDPSKAEDLRDGLVCEFERHGDSRTAKLVVTCVNTDLGDFALAKIFSMRGPGKLGWYHELNTNVMERRKLMGWILREGGIDVSVWTNGHWERQAVIPGVGGRAWTDRLVTLKLDPSADNRVRVKLEGTAGLWRIDAVGLDYSDDAAPQTTECTLTSATTQNGEVITSSLDSSDGSYHAMFTDEWAELTFDTVATRKGMERSFVLETTGYYYAWFAQNEIDEHALVDRILTEPLFGSMLYMKDYLKTKVQVAGK